MSKKNKFEDVFDRPALEKEDNVVVAPDMTEETASETVIEENNERDLPETIYVNALFDTNITDIGYEFLATGEKNLVTVSNGKLYMLQGRQYYVPVDTNVNSDRYNIKVHSDAADRFDVRYIVDSLAAVVPIRHNTILKSGERLCILTKLPI